MTRHARRTIFYLLVVLFPVIGAAVVFYAQGWRLDFETWHLEKVGAILVRPYPADAAITLDGKPIRNRAGFISQSTLISNLPPGSYGLGLAKEGYLEWHESAAVLPSLVTEFRYAVLIPQTPAAIATSSGAIKDFTIAAGGLVTVQPDGTITWRGTVIGHGTPVGAGDNPGALIYKTTAGNYLRYDFSAATTTNLTALLARGGANVADGLDIFPNPDNPAMVVAKSARSVWILNVSQASTTLADRALPGAAIGAPVAATANLIAWTHFSASANASAIALYDPFAKTLTTASATVPGAPTELAWISNGLLGVLENTGALYTYDPGAQKFRKIADDVRSFAAAPDGSAVAAAENRSFEVIPLTDAQTYHRFSLPDPQHITAMLWYRDANHLFIASPDSVSFLDLDDLGLNNFKTVAEGTHPLYNASQNIFYLINPQGNLEWFDFPT